MNKKIDVEISNHNWKIIAGLSAAMFVLMPVSAYLLRQNNLNMLELRTRVLEVDEQTGDINQVAPHLEQLASFSLGHMNADAGRIYLPGTFNKAVEDIRIEAERSGSANSSVYAKAQSKCEDPNVPLTVRAQCIQDYVVANAKPGTDPLVDLNFPDKTLYSYSFSSPAWSADSAGFSVAATALVGLMLIIKVASVIFSRLRQTLVEDDPLSD